MPTERAILIPFLKWPGGKRWFVQYYSGLLPGRFNRYIEPFLGGASVYFHLQPAAAVLTDSNVDLVATYEAVKTNWSRLQEKLTEHHKNHSDRYYYRVRGMRTQSLVSKASRMIYLNRTCFNGIYRTNKKGQFNVPRGDRDDVVKETDDFEAISKLLAGADIRHADFETSIDEARRGDLIFADPPYTVRHNLNGFVRYNETLFSWADQERLAVALSRARRRGAKIVCTNANHSSIRELYADGGFTLRPIRRFSPISATSSSRKQFSELVILANT